MDSTTALTAQALELLGVSDPPESYAALLRSSVSTQPLSQHGAKMALQKVLERAPSPEASQRFAELHESMRARGVRELNSFTQFLKLVGEEPSIASMLNKAKPPGGAAPPTEVDGGSGGASSSASAHRQAPAPSRARAESAPAGGGPASVALSMASLGANWQLTRPYLSGTYLQPEPRDGVADVTPARAAAMLAALPIAQQEEMLVADVLSVLCGVEGTFLRASLPAGAAAAAAAAGHGGAPRLADLVSGSLPRVSFALPSVPISESQMLRADASLLAVVAKLTPLGEQYLQLWQWSHAKAAQLSSGLVVHAFAGALRQCLKEHLVMVAQLQSQHRAKGLRLQQLWYFLQPAARALATLHSLLQAVVAPPPPASSGAVGSGRSGPCSGGALLRLLHARRRSLVGEPERAALLDFLLQRAAAPFFDLLQAWIYRGAFDDPYGEFMVREDASIDKHELTRDFNCGYWQRRFVLAREQVPAFLEPHAQLVLDTGKHLHVVRECGRNPEAPDARADPIVYTTDERALSSWLKRAWEWASQLLIGMLMGEQKLMARLASIKHYFLLDQGDFFVHFLDSAEEELVKPVAHIARGRLHSKLELSLRQMAGTDEFKDSLSCDLLPYNLTKQLLRIINTSKASSAQGGAAAVPTPQSAEKTPGLDAFTFDYAVEWPLSLVLPKNCIIKYQLLFRHLFHCKHVERQLASSWLSQQATKGLAATRAFSASYGLRQRMLHFLQNLEYYMMFEVLEPNWHELQARLRVATKLDELLQQHTGFLDKCLKECMLRDAALLKLLAKLLTVCVIFADHTRLVMQDIATVLAASQLAPLGKERRAQLAARSAHVERTIDDCRYNASVQKLGAKFDEEMAALLTELRRQAHREWNLAHLLARLDYNNYWARRGQQQQQHLQQQQPAHAT